MKLFFIHDIEWDTDCDSDESLEILPNLPQKLTIEAEDEEEAMNRASDEHGFCIHGCKIRPIPKMTLIRGGKS
jgi:hypothetical protein